MLGCWGWGHGWVAVMLCCSWDWGSLWLGLLVSLGLGQLGCQAGSHRPYAGTGDAGAGLEPWLGYCVAMLMLLGLGLPE